MEVIHCTSDVTDVRANCTNGAQLLRKWYGAVGMYSTSRREERIQKRVCVKRAIRVLLIGIRSWVVRRRPSQFSCCSLRSMLEIVTQLLVAAHARVWYLTVCWSTVAAAWPGTLWPLVCSAVPSNGKYVPCRVVSSGFSLERHGMVVSEIRPKSFRALDKIR